ncbi:MAG: chemotaxis protein CheW [Chloroflexia bacterium]|nr:chemotaxis protein CheW [Chloroflexia bacterium]
MPTDEGLRIMFLRVKEHRFGAEVGQIATLRKKETLYPAQEGPPDLQGFLSLGARAVPVLELGDRLGLPGHSGALGLLIVTSESRPLAFRVDWIEGPSLVPWPQLRPLPKLLRELQARPLVWGLAWQEDGLVPLLDLERIVPAEEAASLHQSAQMYTRRN